MYQTFLRKGDIILMEKRINNFEDYGITDDGKVISYKYKVPKQLKT